MNPTNPVLKRKPSPPIPGGRQPRHDGDDDYIVCRIKTMADMGGGIESYYLLDLEPWKVADAWEAFLVARRRLLGVSQVIVAVQGPRDVGLVKCEPPLGRVE